MTYTISNIRQLTSSKGTNYQRADLTDMNGQVYEGVAAFAGEFTREGMSIDGILESDVYNGKTSYKFKLKESVKPAGAAKTAQMEKVMEHKAQHIEQAQERKNDAIAHAGAITNATNLVTAMLEAGMFKKETIVPSGGSGNTGMISVQMLDEEEVKNKVRNYIIWYKNLYLHPEAVNPAAGEPTGDIPF